MNIPVYASLPLFEYNHRIAHSWGSEKNNVHPNHQLLPSSLAHSILAWASTIQWTWSPQGHQQPFITHPPRFLGGSQCCWPYPSIWNVLFRSLVFLGSEETLCRSLPHFHNPTANFQQDPPSSLLPRTASTIHAFRQLPLYVYGSDLFFQLLSTSSPHCKTNIPNPTQHLATFKISSLSACPGIVYGAPKPPGNWEILCPPPIHICVLPSPNSLSSH